MRTPLIACLLVTRCALAQLDDVAFVGSLSETVSQAAFSPTNIAGYPAYAWWVVTGSYSTNGTVGAVLADSGPNALALTNSSLGSAHPVRQIASLNGLDTLLSRDTATYLRTSGNYTSPQPHEVVMVMKTGTTNLNSWYVIDSGQTTYRQRIAAGINTAKIMAFSGGTAIDLTQSYDTNRFYVWDFLFNGATSTNWINNVKDKHGNAGANTTWGFVLGATSSGGTAGHMEVAEVITFQTNLSGTARTQLFDYLTNKYAISP